MGRFLIAAIGLGCSLSFPAPALPSVSGAPSSTAAFAGMAGRGPTDTPTLVRSWGEFVQIFGSADAALRRPYLAPSVQAFFAGGGRRCYVVRVAGAEDAAFIGSDGGRRGRTGLQALRAIGEAAIICIPGVASPAVQSALLSHCEELGDRFALLDAEPDANIEAVLRQRQSLRSERGFGALHYPWVRSDPAETGFAELPPSGFVAGLYARTDGELGVWRAPSSAVLGAAGVTRTLRDAELQSLEEADINPLRFIAGRGVLVWGARTLASDSEWKYAPLRRFAIFLEASIQQGTEWAVFEPNDEPLWARLRVCAAEFLHALWRAGALQGTTPEEAYFVRVDRSTMTSEDIERGRTVLLAGVAPLRPAEFVVLRLVHDRTAQARFWRGDVNGDGRFDLSDPVATLGYLFLGSAAPGCLDAADADDSGTLDVSDAVYGLAFLFQGGPSPREPFEGCGADPRRPSLGCRAFPPCR
jgi:hypothetical protein